MSDDTNIIDTSGISKIIWGKDLPHEQIEPLIRLLLSVRLKYLRDQSQQELTALKKRQDDVAELHRILQSLKTSKAADGSIDISNNEELKGMVSKAKELGVVTQDGKMKYTKEELNDLVENIRMTVEDLNVKNDMQLQTLTRLTNETYESYQLARSIMKPLHDDLINKARGASGR